MKITVKSSRGPRGKRPWKFLLVDSEGGTVGHFSYPADVELTADVILTEAWERVVDPSAVENIVLDAVLRQLFEEGEGELVPLLRRVILSGLLPLLEVQKIDVDELMNRANQIGAFLLPCLNEEEFMATFKGGAG